MQVILVTILLGIFCQVHGFDDECKDPLEDFAASYYTAMIVGHDPKVVNHARITGEEAGQKLYPVVKQNLEEHKQCNAEQVAFTAALALSKTPYLNLPLYFNITANTVGKSLLKYGILDCDNAIDLALEYFDFGWAEARGKDKSKFETFMREVIYGLTDLYLAHGLKLEDTSLDTADTFYDEQSQSNDKECKSKKQGKSD